MSMLIVNAEKHEGIKHMHQTAEEKRSVVIRRPDDWEEWFTISNVEAACAMLRLLPYQGMVLLPK